MAKLVSILLLPFGAMGFGSSIRWQHTGTNHHTRYLAMGLGEFAVELEKPLGIILEERMVGGKGGGVRVESMSPGGAAALNGMVSPGDVLLSVGGKDVSTSSFDTAMETLIEAPPGKIRMTMGDGLGRMNMAQNLAKKLSSEEAFFVDAVVRAAVRVARVKRKMGDVTAVEIVVGAGFRDEEDGGGGEQRCLVRFFALFSKDAGMSTMTCQVSAIGVRRPLRPGGVPINGDEGREVAIISLSCAKDEGLGSTITLI